MVAAYGKSAAIVGADDEGSLFHFGNDYYELRLVQQVINVAVAQSQTLLSTWRYD